MLLILFSICQICDEMEPILSNGGCIVDFHTCDFFPERWFDLVVVLRANNTVLYSRLEKRLEISTIGFL
jgi:adenylate kinase